jgi:methyl-accepting chemotaxis protein
LAETKKWKSLRVRIFLVSAAAVFFFSLVATVAFGVFFVAQAQYDLLGKSDSISQILARQLTVPIDFALLLGQTEESEDANSILSAVLSDSDFNYAIVYTKDGAIFAKAGKPPQNVLELFKGKKQNSKIITDRLIHVNTAISKDNKNLGYLYMGFSKEKVQVGSKKILRYAILLALGLSVIFIGIFYLMISRTTLKPLMVITEILKRFGEGDARPIDNVKLGTDTTELVEMFDALEMTTRSVRENMKALALVASELNNTSDLILEHSNNLSVAANEQAAAVSETTVTIEEVEKTGHITASNAKNIQSTAVKTEQLSEHGLRAVQTTREQLVDIQNQVEQIVESSHKLNTELEEVDRIVASVAAVTQQSHTLSINASIEAVKAGKTGRGFAVVANRIRDLSLQSREATEQVRKTLTGIQAAIAQIVLINEKGLESARLGVSSMEQTGDLISKLGSSIEESTEAAKNIAHNTMQQAIGLEQTSRAMNEINNATHDNLSAIDRLHKSGEDLKDHSISLQALVELFQIE